MFGVVSALKGLLAEHHQQVRSRHFLEASPEEGKAKVLEAVTQLSGDEELAPLLLRVCVAIGKTDCDFSEREREVVATLCDVLGLESLEIDSQPEAE